MPENALLPYISDAARRRMAGSYGATAYDVQTPGPGVIDTVGLLSFMFPPLSSIAPLSANYAEKLGSAAAKGGADWVKARMFMDAGRGAEYSLAPGNNAARWWGVSPAPGQQGMNQGWLTRDYPSNTARELSFLRRDHMPFGATAADTVAVSGGTSLGPSYGAARAVNEIAPLRPQEHQVLNALIRDRRPDLTLVPGGRL